MASSTIAILERLIAFDTVSARSNLALIRWIGDYLAELGIAVEIIPAPDGQPKANLWATIGPVRDGGIVLSGHTDVVPVDGQPWSSDPFQLRDGGARLYGRGTCDMKGFIAICLALVPEMLAQPLRTPLHFAFSYDEELGCLGAPHLLAAIGQRLPRPRIAIIGEPTGMKLGIRHKGVYSFATEVTGKDGHSSQPGRGLNAIALAAEVIGEMNRIYAGIVSDGPFDRTFDPPHSSFNLGTIEGGTAVNIIARQCRFLWDFRAIPGGHPDQILKPLAEFVAQRLDSLRKSCPEADIVTIPRVAGPALVEEHDSAAEALLKHLTGVNETVSLPYATEAGQFQEAGMSAIVCGPGHIAQAHQPDEFVDKDQMQACEALMRRLIGWAREN
ncbi:MAG: acetylornithine deacetylase [Rhodospirillaceae bacterium]|nr:acetylornithine deacetylase [Rhodospirillaceae bacterium]